MSTNGVNKVNSVQSNENFSSENTKVSTAEQKDESIFAAQKGKEAETTTKKSSFIDDLIKDVKKKAHLFYLDNFSPTMRRFMKKTAIKFLKSMVPNVGGYFDEEKEDIFTGKYLQKIQRVNKTSQMFTNAMQCAQPSYNYDRWI